MTKLVFSSAADISEEVCRSNGFGVAPCEVRIKDGIYKDLDLAPEELYEKLKQLKKGDLTQTSAPTPGDYIDAIRQVLSDDDFAIVLSLPSKYSHDFDSARNAASTLLEEYRQNGELKHIEVIETPLVSAPLGLAIMQLSDHLKRDGNELSENINKIRECLKKYKRNFDEKIEEYHERLNNYLKENIFDRTRVYATLEDFGQLNRSGRLNDISFFFATMLKIHPILYLENGEIKPEKNFRPRNHSKTIERIIQRVENDINQLKPKTINYILVHANIPERLKELELKIDEFVNTYKNKLNVNKYPTSRLGSAIGTHGGYSLHGIALNYE